MIFQERPEDRRREQVSASVLQEGEDPERGEGGVRGVALAGVAAPVEDGHLPAQVRRSAAERELGHHRRPLCGEVGTEPPAL